MSIIFSKEVTDLLKNNRDRLLLWRYNQNLKLIIERKMKAFESETGALSKQDKYKCDSYAKEILGWKGYSIGLQLYTLRAGIFKEGWIPENYFYTRVMPKWQGQYGQTSNLRCLNSKFFKSKKNLDLAYLVNNRWYTINFTPINEYELLEILKKTSEKVVFKLDSSYQGRGIYIQQIEKLNLSYLKKLGNGVLQRFIKQHEFFNQFTTNSVSCVRITSVISLDGSPEVRGAFLRIGQSKDSYVNYESEIAVAINMQNGKMQPTGYYSDWTSCNFHPDSKVHFENKKIPLFKNMIETVLNLHKQMPLVGIIGWDVIVDENNDIVLMEWNGYGSDVAFSEFSQGPCFKNLGWETLKP
ncbi:sugar-transfer associated ATP-grasp domain-containing protein [Maribacter sp. M208]|uniref:sugar-transfer associated ATP-grasp domain-containing protein n=1 Tax=Maribacter huludaoensis TaxID=3030010 RepID=UPI0023EBF527|nr:sugar-transfer associated ATP-grasp domain-containing protein [Maribacter huludaoensis]MDF4221144.1 sugar-transfer associated ATP-grasp domain-containing protein [Maribacter huludaoensis]